MVIQRLKELEFGIVLLEKLQCPVPSTSRDDSQTPNFSDCNAVYITAVRLKGRSIVTGSSNEPRIILSVKRSSFEDGMVGAYRKTPLLSPEIRKPSDLE